MDKGEYKWFLLVKQYIDRYSNLKEKHNALVDKYNDLLANYNSLLMLQPESKAKPPKEDKPFVRGHRPNRVTAEICFYMQTMRTKHHTLKQIRFAVKEKWNIDFSESTISRVVNFKR